MTGRQVLVSIAAWLMAVGSVASLSWVAIDSAGHEVAYRDNAAQYAAAPAALRTTPTPDPSPTVPASSPTVSTELTSVEITPAAPARTTTRRSTATHPTTGTGHRTTSRPPSVASNSTIGPTQTTTTDAAQADEPTVIVGGYAFEQWLRSIAPDGVIRLPGLVVSVNFYPSWYGRFGQGRTIGGDHDNGRYGRFRGYPGYGSAAPNLASGDTETDDTDRYAGWTTRSLSTTAGLVWLNCAGGWIRDWNATPQDGWALQADRRGRHLEVRFHQDGQIFEVQAGCVDSRPAFRYRELDAGSSADQEWLTSVA